MNAWWNLWGPLPRSADRPWSHVVPPGASGRAMVLGAVATVLAMVLTLLVVPSWRDETAAARAELAAKRAERVRAADLSRRLQPQPSAGWPAASEDPARLRTLLALAQRHGVQVRTLHQERAVSRVAARAREGGARWLQVSMVAEGGYAGLRHFVEEALAQDAALALDSLVLQRAGADSPGLRAELGWALASAAP